MKRKLRIDPYNKNRTGLFFTFLIINKYAVLERSSPEFTSTVCAIMATEDVDNNALYNPVGLDAEVTLAFYEIQGGKDPVS